MTPRKKILLVEDEELIREMMRSALSDSGFEVLQGDSVKAGLHEFRTRTPDLVVLDINLPDGDGFEVCKKIRASKNLSKTPIIMLTSRGALEDKAEAFGAGADQYLVKPVNPSELILWCQALLRRLEYDSGQGAVLRAGELVIEPEAHVVRYGEKAVLHLTVKEFELLYFLLKNRPKVISRKHILSNLWHTITVDNVVDVHISNLRKKLPPDAANRIHTVPGRGYRFY